MAEKCLKCFRPLSTCYCSAIEKIETGIKFVFLMHPKEAYRQHTGTGRLASLSLPDSEIIVGVDFSENKRLNQLLSDSTFFHLVLYPGTEAITASDAKIKQAVSFGKKIMVIVIDSTWFFAKKILRLSTNVKSLPKLTFSFCYQSQFQFKKQPAQGCISTIESCYYLILEMQKAALIKKEINPEPLMNVFKKMVAFQLQSEKQRIDSGIPGRHAYDAKRDGAKKSKPE
ncbi:MAG: DTW domain-containing protein [Spirochaetaceae bacterium]|nr:DTW domain-containing protein [Spirochaetaceae bacterium]